MEKFNLKQKIVSGQVLTVALILIGSQVTASILRHNREKAAKRMLVPLESAEKIQTDLKKY